MFQFEAGNCRNKFRCIISVHQFGAFLLFIALGIGNRLCCFVSGFSTCWVEHHPTREMVFDKNSYFPIVDANTISIVCDEVVRSSDVPESVSFRFDVSSTCVFGVQLSTKAPLTKRVYRNVSLCEFCPMPFHEDFEFSHPHSVQGYLVPLLRGKNRTFSTAPSAPGPSADSSTIGRA